MLSAGITSSGRGPRCHAPSVMPAATPGNVRHDAHVGDDSRRQRGGGCGLRKPTIATMKPATAIPKIVRNMFLSRIWPVAPWFGLSQCVPGLGDIKMVPAVL